MYVLNLFYRYNLLAGFESLSVFCSPKYVSMLKRFGVFVVLVVLLYACAGSRQAAFKSNTDPTYVKKNYQNLIVFAKVEELVYRKKLEEAVVAELKKNGFTAIPAYSNLEVSYKYDSTQFMNRMRELSVDGFIAIDYLGQQTRVQDTYRYNGGVYSVVGSYVPFDLETKSYKTGYLRVDFYNGDTRTTRWNTVVSATKTADGLDKAIESAAREIVVRLKADKII